MTRQHRLNTLGQRAWISPRAAVRLPEELMTELCPHCGAELTGAEIPESDRRVSGNQDHFSRKILVEVPEIYDGGLYWECPDCAGRWHRWPEGHHLRKVAEQYVQRGLN